MEQKTAQPQPARGWIIAHYLFFLVSAILAAFPVIALINVFQGEGSALQLIGSFLPFLFIAPLTILASFISGLVAAFRMSMGPARVIVILTSLFVGIFALPVILILL